MSSFASGKFALRATGQSLAREFGPKGIHIAHVILDGVIDITRTQEWPVNGGVPDGKINSDAVSSSPHSTPKLLYARSSADKSFSRLLIHIGVRMKFLKRAFLLQIAC